MDDFDGACIIIVKTGGKWALILANADDFWLLLGVASTKYQ